MRTVPVVLLALAVTGVAALPPGEPRPDPPAPPAAGAELGRDVEMDLPDWLALLPAPPPVDAPIRVAWPLRGVITQPYGCTGSGLERPLDQCPGFHRGIDIAQPEGVPVHAGAAGLAYGVPDRGRYGNHVLIQHPNGYATVYGHLSRLGAGWGQPIAGGALIGWVGSTGNSTGPHLHFELRHGGAPLDPMPFLEGTPPPVPALPAGWPGAVPDDQRGRR